LGIKPWLISRARIGFARVFHEEFILDIKITVKQFNADDYIKCGSSLLKKHFVFLIVNFKNKFFTFQASLIRPFAVV
jgi:hypothetical protein